MEVTHIAKRICDCKDLDNHGKDIYEALYLMYNSREKAEYRKNSKTLWKILKLENNFNYIKIKALIIKVIRDDIFVLIPSKNSESNRKNAIYQDIAYIMFDLLDRRFYNKEGFGVKNIGTYEMRYDLYIETNNYTRECFVKSRSAEYKRSERIIASIANFLSKKDDVKNYLQKAINEYTEISNGKQKLKLQKPCFTLETFPSANVTEQPKSINVAPKRITISSEEFGPTNYVKEECMADEAKTQKQEFCTSPIIEKVETQPTESTPENADTLSFVNGYSEKFKNWKQNVRNILIPFNKYTKLMYTALSIIVSATNYNYQSRILPESTEYYSVTTEVRLADNTDKTWKKSVDAKIGDKVEFQINYENISDAAQTHVAVNDILPPNLKYINGTTKVYNGTYPKGFLVDSNEVVASGILIGTYEPGANALIRFSAIVDENFDYRNPIQRSYGRVTVNKNDEVIQDFAAVNVQLAYCPNPEKSL